MHRPHILVVEDSRVVSVLLARSLEIEGYDVTVVSDGLDGYERGLVGDIDLALIDHLLPGLLGTEILHRWRQEGCLFPVIVISNMSGEEDVTKAFELGAHDYVRKPFSVRELVARIRIHLARIDG